MTFLVREESQPLTPGRPGNFGLAAEEVRRHVAAHLASFKVPEIVEFTDQALPRNPAGKILKNLLRGGKAPFSEAAF